MNKGLYKNKKPGLYVHFPFCKTKCPYCDFYSIPSLTHIPQWLDGLQSEVLHYKGAFTAFDSLYLGGGTPSLLSEEELTTLMGWIFAHFTFSQDSEITIEVNPDDVTLQKLSLFKDLGINRISLGVQSFDDRELSHLGRRHTVGQTVQAIEWIRTSGFTNLGIDLMYGIPGQTDSAWIKTLKSAFAFEPEHLSCYQLTFEEETPFGKMVSHGRIKPLSKERERRFFLLTSAFLENRGYIHYEISNFARNEGYTSRHNQKYWNHTPYLGLGPGAHSFREGIRWWNSESVAHYYQTLQEGKLPVAGRENLSDEQVLLESLYLGMRARDGIDLTVISSQARWEKILNELEESGLVTVHDGRVTPTRQGFLVADTLPLLFIE